MSGGRLSPRFVDLPSGARIEYLEAGTGEFVVYFHGAGGVFRNATFLGALGQRYRVLAPSRPGYDGSTGTCASAHDEAAVMAEFIRTIADGPAHVIAESAGGACGCWLAILEPSLVESLTLVAPAAFAGATHAPPPTSPAAMELRLFGPNPAWSDSPSEEDRAARQRNAAANASKLRPAHNNADLQARLGEIAARTLILWGTADEVIPPESGRVYVRGIPNSYRVLIYGGAHSLPVAACQKFVSLTSDFIERGDRFVVAEPQASQAAVRSR